MLTDAQKEKASQWFSSLQSQICTVFKNIEEKASLEGKGIKDPAEEGSGQFTSRAWQHHQGGGGISQLLKGRVFEKVGVNVSTVYGEFPPEFRAQIPGAEEDPRFWASGISLVSHMWSPWIPAIHMNTRMIETTKSWFGGGIDLTPMFPDEEEARLFHDGLQKICQEHDATYYDRFKKWCDEYFYLAHRGEPRGVGGIFFDYINSGDWETDFAFVQSVGKYIMDIYPLLIERNLDRPWGQKERQHQLYRRGRYVEFNLLYDRGTVFGLKTGGNVESILMSLPPEVKWA
jgi:coproporphyrinogen III oxidase